MTDTPVVSGSDLTSNAGNAALGYSSGISYDTNPATANPLEGVDHTLNRIAQEDFIQRQQRHAEQRQDIDGIYQMLHESNGSLFNMKDANGNNISFSPLPEDKKVLDKQAEKLRKIILANPETYKTKSDFYDANKELNYMTRHASARAAFSAHQNQLASGEQNGDERQGLLDNLNKQVSSPLTDYQTPVPYREGPKFKDELADPKLWQDPDKLQKFGTSIVGKNGTNYELTKSGVPTNEIYKPLTDVSNAGLTNAQNAMALWLRRPEAYDPQYIQSMNAQIAKNAEERGVKPVFGATVTPEGKVVYSQDPRALLAAHNMYSYGGLRSEEKPSDAAIKQEAEKAGIEHTKAATKEFKSRLDLEYAKMNNKDDAIPVKPIVDEMYSTYTKYRNNVSTPIADQKIPGLTDKMNELGMTPSRYTIGGLNPKDKKLINIAGIKATGLDGKTTDNNAVPAKAYYIKSTGGIGEDMMAFQMVSERKEKEFNKAAGKDIEKVVPHTEWVMVPLREALVNTIKSEHGDKGAAVAKSIGNAQELLDRTMKSETAKDAEKETDSDDVIAARLVPITWKFPDGRTEKRRKDPKTGLIYPL